MLKEKILVAFPKSDVRIGVTRVLCSFCAELAACSLTLNPNRRSKKDLENILQVFFIMFKEGQCER